MGIAMLWIMLYHTGISFSIIGFDYFKFIGYGGVDIFLFASGIGNYYSYNKDEAPLRFLKRRISRLAPVYVPFIVIWGIIHFCLGDLAPNHFLGNVLGIQIFSNVGLSFNWYIGALLICYILTPFIASFIKDNSLLKNIILVVVMLLATTAFWNDLYFVIIAVRIPIYVIGMIFAKHDSVKLEKIHVLLGFLIFFLGNMILFFSYSLAPFPLWPYGMLWYPFILITPFLCYLISFVAQFFDNKKILSSINKAVGFIGKYSFELYLVHIDLFVAMPVIWEKLNLGFELNNYIWILMYLIAFIGAFILHMISKLILKLFSKKAKAA